MKKNEKYWVKTLKRLSEISGQSVPDLLNSYWQCEVDCVEGQKPFAVVKNHK